MTPELLWTDTADYLPPVGERVIVTSIDGKNTTLEVKEVYRHVRLLDLQPDLGMSEYSGIRAGVNLKSSESSGTVILETAAYRLF